MWGRRGWVVPALAAVSVTVAVLIPSGPERAADAAPPAGSSGSSGRSGGGGAAATADGLLAASGWPGAAAAGTGGPPSGPSSGAPSTPPAAAPTAAPPSAPPVSFTLVATGDVLTHAQLRHQAEVDAARAGRSGLDFAPMLAAVKPHVAGADLGLCHLETPLGDADGPFTGYPIFAAPPQVVTGLKATGYDACSTASNHTFDGGAAGVTRTLRELDRVGLAHAGSARTPAEAARTTIVTVRGVKVALLAYTYGFNGIPYPGGDRWRANLIDVKAIAAAARTARQRGAEVVVLSLHWGTEYQQSPNPQQRALAPLIAAVPDVDVVIGHHAHVVLPIQRIGRTWVVFGLGNLVGASADWGSANAEGLLVRFRFTRNASGRFDVTTAEYLPLLVTRSPLRVLDVPAALAAAARGDGGPAGTARLRTALRRTTAVVTSRGAVAAGLRPLAP